MPVSAATGHDRFELRGQLGAGANGVVHRVFDRVRGREIAIKTLLNPGGRELYRFKREFRALADLVHPNLVALHELYTTDGEWMFTMDLVDGVSFQQWVRPPIGDADEPPDDAATSPSMGTGPLAGTLGALRVPRLRDALGQLADGLVALHGAGKLHRDVKPSNVLVDGAGRVAILDFGLIAATDASNADRTHERGAVGTPAYMSPEQAADRSLTDASDWYAVGVMMFEALTGRRIFEGSSEALLHRKQHVDPPAPRQLADVPADLDALCSALLARDPQARPDGRAVLAALGRTASAATERIVEQSARPPFVGRGDELAELRRAHADARDHGVTTIVVGPSGMGKTAVVRAFLDEISVSGEAMIVEGRCYERESVPFKALDGVIDGLTALLVAREPAEIARLIPGDAGALARLFPVFRRVPGVPPALPGLVADPLQLRRQALAALRELLAALATTGPVVLSIDDLQWGDADSAAAIAELIGGPHAPRMLVICTHRAEDIHGSVILGPIEEAVAADLRRIEVGALPDLDAHALWGALHGRGGGDVAVRDAAGNPLLLAEIARSDSERAPVRSVDEAVRARLTALAPDAGMLLRTIAVAARPLSTTLIMRAAGLDDGGRAALTTLRLERLVRIRGAAEATLEPSHDRIREAVIASMSDGERRHTHAAIAAALTVDGGDRELLVEHTLGAGDGITASRHAEAAARDAEDRLALHRAAELYGLALTHGQLDDAARSALTARRAHTLAAAGRVLESAVEYQAAAALVPWSRARRELQRRSVEQMLRAGQLERGIAAAAELLRTVGVGMPGGWRRTILALILERIRLRLRGMSYRVRPERELDADALERIDVLWSVATGFTFVNPVMVRVLATRMLRAALASGELRRIALAIGLEVGYVSTGGSAAHDRVEALYAQARALAEQLDQDDVRGFVETTAGVAAYLGGRYRDARRRLDAGEVLLGKKPTEVRWQLDICQVFQISNHWYLGEIKELARRQPAYLREAIERGNVHLQRGLRGWRSNVAWLIRDDVAGARTAAALATPPRAPGEPFHLHHWYDLIAQSAIDHYERGGEAAWARVDAAWRDLGRSHLLRIQAVDTEAHLLRGAAAVLCAGQHPRRLAVAERCVDHLDRIGSAPARVATAQLRAAVEAHLGHRDRAIEALHAAIAAADEHGLAGHRAAAQLRLGLLRDDAEGGELVIAAEAWFRAQDVVRPRAFARLMTPGVPED